MTWTWGGATHTKTRIERIKLSFSYCIIITTSFFTSSQISHRRIFIFAGLTRWRKKSQIIAKGLADPLPNAAQFNDPNTKALVLLQCHFGHKSLSSYLHTDQKKVVRESVPLIQRSTSLLQDSLQSYTSHTTDTWDHYCQSSWNFKAAACWKRKRKRHSHGRGGGCIKESGF